MNNAENAERDMGIARLKFMKVEFGFVAFN